jgi:hypothetical protein
VPAKGSWNVIQKSNIYTLNKHSPKSITLKGKEYSGTKSQSAEKRYQQTLRKK